MRTPTGSKLASQVWAGDMLLSRNEHDPNGLVVAQTVEEVFAHEALVMLLRIHGIEIETTAEHPFYVWGRGWVECHELKSGDLLRLEDGWAPVDAIEDTGRWETVYNFRIADFHTYFVGCAEWGIAVWAHNACDEAHNAMNYERYKKSLAAEEIANPGDPMKGKVVFVDPVGGTTLQGQNMIREAVALGNLAEQNGFLSPTGRVSTLGALRADASAAAAAAREAAAEAGTPFRYVVGHGPDTTWTNRPVSPYWQDVLASINSSLGSQSRRYPIGYKPTGFVYSGDL